MTSGLLKAAGLALLAGTIALSGCAGSAGKDGASGANGTNGNDGANGADGADGAAGPQGPPGVGLGLPATQKLFVTNLAFGTNAGSQLTATFDVASGVTAGTTAVTGLARTAVSLNLAGLAAGTAGSSDEWQTWASVVVTTLTEGPAGHYVATSTKTAADAPANTATQRGYVRVSKSGVIGGMAGYDFALAAPGTAVASPKDVVNDASCKACHGLGVTIHSYGRNDTKLCVVCHSPLYNATIASHGADMVTMVHQIHQQDPGTDPTPVVTGFTPDALGTTPGGGHWAGHGENWATLVYPGNMLDCAKCHNTVANADNWKTRPTRVACQSCHKSIRFDGTAFFGIKRGNGELHTAANDSTCTACHPAAKMAADHPTPASYDAAKRPLEATITGATIDANGVVTVSFTLTDAGAAVVSPTAFTSLSFTLTKLVPGVGDAPSRWQSYLSKARTKSATLPPVVQARTESYPADGGALTQVGSTNEYVYRFGLANASTPGDIRTIDHVHNSSTVAGAYNQANLPTLRYVVPYEPTLTHRIAMSVQKVATPNVPNKTNAFYDFVPAGTAVTTTRSIVSRAACAGCHGDKQLHAGYAIEYCVGCHNQNSFDPYSGYAADAANVTTMTDTVPLGSSSVALERVVHKIHMGKDLSSGFVLNGEDYSHAQYPGGIPSSTGTPKAQDCRVCHDESNAAMKNAASWKTANRACGSCHDGVVAQAHIAANTYDPTPGPTPAFSPTNNGWKYSGDELEACSVCHAPGGLAPVDEAHFGVVR
jgi:hypothetical protein